MDTIAPLMSDRDRYLATFVEISKRSKRFEIFENWINSSFPEEVVKTLGVDEKAEVRMLGVGSGSGLVESFALKQLLTKWSKIKHTVVEPNLELIGQFKDLAIREKDNLTGVTFDWNPKTLEEFRRETSDQSIKYHLIMAIQIIYYFHDVDELIKYLTSILAEGGIMVIVKMAENSCYWKIVEKFPQLQNNIRDFVSTRNIEQMLTANNTRFKTYQLDARIDSTGCFDADSKEGELVFDMITHVAYLKKQTSESLYNEIIEYIKSDEISLPKGDDGKTWLRSNYDVIFVTK